ncbi:hypothetical protein GCM10009547_44710 [Sporichthya brevicatena]|uniref:Prepilin-type N-terminal cleavage/methylation domain-containing protein n=1 Tax=Sporichthya brevicatena TaxID=171442 RepID=A0ABP3SIU8_9ACTN
MAKLAVPAARPDDPGFSMIELLVVILVIGVLAAIALPSYLGQRDKAHQAGEKADARSVAAEIETFFVDAHRYPQAGDLSWSAGPRTIDFPGDGGVHLSPNNEARIVSDVDAGHGFCVEVRNAMTAVTAVFESEGGLRHVGAGAACSSAYEHTVLAYPAG